MDSEISHTSVSHSLAKCCGCVCSCSTMNGYFSGTYLRSVKRKYDEFEEEGKALLPLNARIDMENECNALRETVESQQQKIQELIAELEEERNAAASAAEEAMSMILRLQREKAEILMESRQFKRFAEEKMAHDQNEISALEEFLYKREQMIQSLSCESHAYQHRMMSYGLMEDEADGAYHSSMESFDGQIELPSYEVYPPLKCRTNEFQGCPNQPDVLEKLVVDQSLRRAKHSRKFSSNSLGSLGKGKEDFAADSPRFGTSLGKNDLELEKAENTSEGGRGDDDTSDRVYTVDSVHEGCVYDHKTDPKDSLNHADVRDLEIQKLYARLHALEADRESMRRAIVSIGTDKAQLVLLKEIAQNLCKDMSSPAFKEAPTRKQSVVGRFSFVALFKWIISFIFRRRKAHRCRYVFGSAANNVGLLVLLNRGPRVGQWRRITDIA